LTRRPGTLIVTFGLLALLLRLAVIVATPHLALSADPKDYDRHARSIATVARYPTSSVDSARGPTAIRPPGFPYLLGAVYAVTDHSVTAGRVLQAVLGALVVMLVALIAVELFGVGAAGAAGLLAAVFPPLIIDGITLLSEPLFVALELAALYAVLRWRRTRGFGWVALAGIATGLALLTRANALAVLVVLAFAAREGGSWRTLRTWRAPATLVAIAAIAIAPWTIRNAVAFGSLIPVSTQDGYTLIGTYNQTSFDRDAIWIPANLDHEVANLIRRNRELDEAALNGVLRSEARKFALDHPKYVAQVAGRNLLRLFNLGGASYERQVAVGDYGLGPRWGTLMTWSLLPILVLAAFGLATQAARAAPRWFWVLPLLLLTTVFVLATNRHRAAMDPFLLIAAALALERLWTRLRPDFVAAHLQRRRDAPPDELAVFDTRGSASST
jgi:4-amino-4-deoxy-L-arabinose transferase-like glycosyltransferase